MSNVMEENASQREFCAAIDEMTRSMSSVRESIQSLRVKQASNSASPGLDFKDGISLLSLKHHIMLSYLQSLVLLSSHKILGHTLDERSPPSLPFGSVDRDARGSNPGDFVDSMLEGRVVLEKIKMLEGRMKYQIEKLVRLAEEAPAADKDVMNDPLAFRPNPQALMGNGSEGSENEGGSDAEDTRERDGIYRPPKLAPMPYTEPTKDKKDKSRRAPVPTALSNLVHLDPSKPHVEAASGLGAMPSMSSARAREIQRMNEFEEENMTRLVMKKKDARRRKMDEADIALGGVGGLRGRKRGSGLEEEFGDVLRSVGRRSGGGGGDGYEELRVRGKKAGVLARGRAREEGDFESGAEEGPRQRKRSRFERETKAARKREAVRARR